MNGFFHELKRRKVYRVAVAYVVAAGGIIQLASAVFPAWELPNWALRLTVVMLLLGFPIALILAWAFDVTPEGIRATAPVPALEGAVRRSRRNLYILLAVGIIVSLGAGFFLLPPRASAEKMDKSIAVLPFENFSDDKENAFFADGIQDDILTNLAKIGDLKVISRTSVMSYRGKPASVREIGKALGVGAVLEGSVRKSGNRVRVNVQLVNATTDQHIWAQEYDRDLTDVFAIQSDLAQKIAAELQAKLSPTEKAFMTRKPTENGEAYLAYVQAGNLYMPEDVEKLKQSAELYQRAIELDPKFALAFARYSHLESWIYRNFDNAPARRAKARALADEAMKLQPDLPEAHLALGYCYYYGDLDYDRAQSEFKIAQSGLPNDPEVLLSLGAIQRRKGDWAESTANFEKAAAVNPKDPWVLQNLAINYQRQRNYAAAQEVIERGLALAPNSISLRSSRAQLAIEWKGDLSVAEEELAKAPSGFDPNGFITEMRVSLLMSQRKFPEALALLQNSPIETIHAGNGKMLPKIVMEAAIHLLNGDKAKAREAAEKVRDFFEQKLRESPNDADLHVQLGFLYVALGRKEDAIREGRKATELLPESKDAFDGPAATLALSQIYAWTGETDQALALVERSLNTISGVSVQLLKLDPIWDPLRKDPRFQALIDKYSAKG